MQVRIAIVGLAVVAVLGACGQEDGQKSDGVVKPAASSSTTTAPTTLTTAEPTTTTTVKPTTTTTVKPTTTTTRLVTTTTTAASVYYANCDAVRAAGKAPLYRGDPGYASKLDRDNDGIACE